MRSGSYTSRSGKPMTPSMNACAVEVKLALIRTRLYFVTSWGAIEFNISNAARWGLANRCQNTSCVTHAKLDSSWMMSRTVETLHANLTLNQFVNNTSPLTQLLFDQALITGSKIPRWCFIQICMHIDKYTSTQHAQTYKHIHTFIIHTFTYR